MVYELVNSQVVLKERNQTADCLATQDSSVCPMNNDSMRISL